MSGRTPSKRSAPAVAARNEALAVSNVGSKCEELKRLLGESSRGLGEGDVRDLPMTLAKFCRWAPVIPSIGRTPQLALSATSPKTLRKLKHRKLLERVQEALHAVRTFCAQQKTASRSREDSVRRLRAELLIARELAAIAQREVMRARIEIEKLKREQEAVPRHHPAHEDLKREVAGLMEQITLSRRENAILRAQLLPFSKPRVIE